MDRGKSTMVADRFFPACQSCATVAAMKHEHPKLSRRSLLAGGAAAAAGVSGALVSGGPLAQDAGQAAAGPPQRNPWIYRFTIGAIEAWSISDGFMKFGQGLDLMFPEEERGAMKEVLEAAGEGLDIFPLYVNVLVLRLGNEVVLFDAGFGEVDHPDRGWLGEGLRRIGIRKEEVTLGLLSHAHGDHLGGFVGRDGKPMYPNAGVHVREEELAFWRAKEPDFSRERRPKEWIPGMVQAARDGFDALEGVLQPVKCGTELLGGAITVEDGTGHTMGHAVYRIRSQGEELLHIMDVAHHHLLMFARPHWVIGFDNRPDLAVATRKRLYNEAVAGRARVYGFHLPWPGLGRIVKAGDGHRWQPERMWW